MNLDLYARKDLYIVLLTYPNKDTLDKVLEEVRSRFENTKFSVRGSVEKGWQLRLEGGESETRPRAFAEGFIVACERMMKEVKNKEDTK